MTLEELERLHASPDDTDTIDIEFEAEDEDETAVDLSTALIYLGQCKELLEAIIYPKPKGRSITKNQATEASALAQEIGVFINQWVQDAPAIEESVV